jgi:DNA-binding NarL/FixJ family response regulator
MGTRVMIVDDHRMVRDGLRSLLEQEDGISVVGEASNGRECLSIAKVVVPDIVIMDIAMPDMNGVEATRNLSETVKKTKVLALSMTTDRRLVQEILRAGARGFLIKDSAFEELVRAIEVIQGGDPYLSPAIQGILIGDYVKGSPDKPDASAMTLLSGREREVLQLIAEGVSTKNIAEKLGRCVKTIETHRANIMTKVGLRNLPQLTKYAIQEGLTAVEL